MKQKRIIAFLLDTLIAFIICMLLCFVLSYLKMGIHYLTITTIIWIMLFCKDCFNGQSIGKRIMRIQVKDVASGQIASPTKCICRNLCYFFTFVEVVVMYYSSKNFRIGDYVMNTHVDTYDKTLKGYKSIQILFPIVCVIVISIVYLLVANLRFSMLEI